MFVTDGWYPQVNGVVRSLDTVGKELEKLGHETLFVGPDRFATMPLPTYSEIRIALFPGGKLKRIIEAASPDAIHIATEGPLGWAARDFCLINELQFTTSYHTRFPEYIRERAPIPLAWTYRMLRVFHGPSSAVMVATATIEEALRRRGFGNIRRWSRGVDTDLFRPRDKALLDDLPRPIHTYVGRVAVEKNLKAFLDLKLDGTKLIVGDGPQLEALKRQYPQVVFTGAKFGEELAAHFAASDVFVFPSRTDTFGLVLLEALASGIPVAAYPVPGPIDVLGPDGSGVGVLDEDLGKAVAGALKLADAQACRQFALGYSWEASARQFQSNLDPFMDRLATRDGGG